MMPSPVNLIRSGLLHHRRMHLLTALGTAIAAATLCGALMIGDSLRTSLRLLADSRLGKVNFVVTSTTVAFHSRLADSLATRLEVRTAPVFQRFGTATANQGRHRANRVHIIGIDQRFGQLSSSSRDFPVPDSGEVVVGNSLARKLGIRPGDDLVLRFDRGEALSLDAPLSGGEGAQTILRVQVSAIVDREQFGEFSLKAEHGAVHNVFLPLQTLSSICNQPGRATAVLIGPGDSRSVDTEEVASVIDDCWTLADAGLHLRIPGSGNGIEIHSDGIFLADSLLRRIGALFPDAVPVFTWFVNELSHAGQSTPYSFVSTPVTGDSLPAGAILLGQWVAGDLGAGIGDSVLLTYFVLHGHAGLREDSARFAVHGIVPDRLPWADSTLMPPFPGLKNAVSCTEWNPGIPIDLDRIRPRDEAYWDRHRGTPKAFIGYASARRLWGNRFGVSTAVRLGPGLSLSSRQVLDSLRTALSPGMFGIHAVDLRSGIISAIDRGISFTPLFLGLSFFIIVAAVILTALLFGFSLRNRTDEIKSFAAMGFTRAQIGAIFLGEGLLVALLGTTAGILVSPLYTAGILLGLHTVWHAAAPVSVLGIHIRISSCLIATGVTVLIAGAVVMLSVKSSLDSHYRGMCGPTAVPATKAKRSIYPSIHLFLIATAVLLIASHSGRGMNSAGGFFAAGALFLAALISLFHSVLVWTGNRQGAGISRAGLVWSGLTRNRARTVTTAATFACALFVLGTVGNFRHAGITDPRVRQSGTGGFQWYGETVGAIPRSHATLSYLRDRGLDGIDSGIFLLPLRLREGDDASCLNLNRVEHPPILGVDQRIFDSLNAFSFARVHQSIDPRHPWRSLEQAMDHKTIPAIADETVIQWGLGKARGDTIRYVDDHGSAVDLVLVAALDNSIFQGRIVISEDHFIRHFPSNAGYRAILADAPPGRERAVKDALASTFMDHGIEIETCAQRLALFSGVENTYLSVFFFLGIVGLVLGSAGMGIVVTRNIHERRDEIALLRSVGFRDSTVRNLITAEHGIIFLAGILAGFTSSLIASIPNLRTGDPRSLFIWTILPTVLTLLPGLFWSWFGIRTARDQGVEVIRVCAVLTPQTQVAQAPEPPCQSPRP